MLKQTLKYNLQDRLQRNYKIKILYDSLYVILYLCCRNLIKVIKKIILYSDCYDVPCPQRLRLILLNKIPLTPTSQRPKVLMRDWG